MAHTSKKLLFCLRHAPHGQSGGREALDAILTAAAFEQQVSVLFIDDGVFQLKANQQPEAIASKNFAQTYKALSLYDVENIYVAQDSLNERGLRPDDLLLPVECLDAKHIPTLLTQQDHILSF